MTEAVTTLPKGKMSPTLRTALRALRIGENICVVVTLSPPNSPPAHRRLSRQQRAQRLAAASETLEQALKQIRPVIEDFGGNIVHTHAPLSAITIRGPRPLIERLSKMDAVISIMADQPVHVTQ